MNRVNIWKLYNLYGGGKPQWTVLNHNGPMFPPEYVKHNIPIIISSKEYILPEQAEEYATMYSKFIGTDYIENKTFKKNFWIDFKPTLPKELQNIDLDSIDFTIIKKHLDKIKSDKSELSKEVIEQQKKKQAELEEPYRYCIIDGVQQIVGNFKIEPPGIFLGRGSHPKIGHIKKRIYPEDITLNLSKDAKIPQPLKGHEWGKIINDRSVIWLASWKEEITGKNKYIFTSLDSFFKSASDQSKFDLARKLKRTVGKIREDYIKQLTDSDIKNRQLATALYFIDNLALRVGGSKDTNEQADTVGVTSLRVEHLSLLGDNNIKLDFLGKDSVRYCKKIEVIKEVYINLEEFIKDKKNKDEIFSMINSSMLNTYLDSIMTGLTAKVWRTYNASLLFQKEIDKIKEEKVANIEENERLNYLIAMFNQANTSVALLCNHQKNVNVSADNLINKINDRLKELKKQKVKYQAKKNNKKVKSIEIKIKSLKLKRETKLKMKNVSLGTSKNNYIDPRIIFAFIKRFDVPPEKLFTKVLLKRFEWASNIDKDYRF
jgi:DNA topoisomerase-1